MNQLSLDLPQNELQDKYLQARGLIIRFINGDPNVSKDALDWIERTDQKHAEELHHAGAHIGSVNSSNIARISFYENDKYQLVVEFRNGGEYAYAIPPTVTYLLDDGTMVTRTPQQIFDDLASENEKVATGDEIASVGSLFDALIKQVDKRKERILYKRI